MKDITSPELLTILPMIIQYGKQALTDALVDIRQAVIVLFVEIYLILGDALFPYVEELTSSQKKLLTIYIEKKLKST
jgi:hypothetical protein